MKNDKPGIGVSSKNKASSNFNIEIEMSDAPEAAPNLLDDLEDNLEASEEIKAELPVIKPNIYPPLTSRVMLKLN